MAKKKGKGFRKSSAFTLPVAPIAGLIAGLYNPAMAVLSGNWQSALDQVSRNYIGYSPASSDFEASRMMSGLVPLIIGLLVHKFVGGRLGLNRMLGAAKVPFVRI